MKPGGVVGGMVWFKRKKEDVRIKREDGYKFECVKSGREDLSDLRL